MNQRHRSSTSVSRLSRCIRLVLLALLVTGCHPGSHPANDGQHPASDRESNLRQRAETLWNAKIAENWPIVFQFEEIRPDANVTVDDFIKYCETEEPFQVHACDIGRVLTDRDYGWVEMDVRTSVRRFAGSPEVTTHRWEKWYYRGDVWMPVPSERMDEYPESPIDRDRAEERRLRARFEAAWTLRQDGDWAKLYTFVDPNDRPDIPEDTFTTTHSLIDFKACNIDWVQVIGDNGVVHCTMQLKLTDPSMTKMAIQHRMLREDWVKNDGQWYIDYQRNPSDG